MSWNIINDPGKKLYQTLENTTINLSNQGYQMSWNIINDQWKKLFQPGGNTMILRILNAMMNKMF